MIPDITKKARHAQTQNEHKPARRRPPDNHPAILWALKEEYLNTRPPQTTSTSPDTITMLSQISRLVPALRRAREAETLPRLFSGLNITLRNNTSNLIGAKSIGSMVSLPSVAPNIKCGTKINSLMMTRSVLSNTNVTTNNYNFLGVSSFTSHQVRGFASKKHKRVIKLSKGFRGRANRCFRVAIRRLEKSWQYAYRDRKVKKREFRKLWIQRLNAGVRQQGLSYSKFIEMEGRSGVKLDRKILSGLAMYEPFSFKAVVDVVKKMSAEGK
ncbi:hypothetical protein ACHAXM_011837 [Skeletonema potamos]|jgi:large subunit ribosomal protein L20